MRYCTVVTPDHIDKSIALHRSLRLHDDAAATFVLVTGPCPSINEPGLTTHSLEMLAAADPIIQAIVAKYATMADELRWSLKSAYLRRLILDDSHPVIYLDCDICFFGSPEPLWHALDGGAVLLTPHWRLRDPDVSIHNFRLNYLDGLFNAGCVGATRGGVSALEWWARACLSACENAREKGLFNDQRYLDLLPVYFDDVVISRHRGCNVADWNRHLVRQRTDEGIFVDGWPLVFVHFTRNTIAAITSGRDPVLVECLSEYTALLDRVTRECGEWHS